MSANSCKGASEDAVFLAGVIIAGPFVARKCPLPTPVVVLVGVVWSFLSLVALDL